MATHTHGLFCTITCPGYDMSQHQSMSADTPGMYDEHPDMTEYTEAWIKAGQSTPDVEPIKATFTARDHRKKAQSLLQGRKGMTHTEQLANLDNVIAHLQQARLLIQTQIAKED